MLQSGSGFLYINREQDQNNEYSNSVKKFPPFRGFNHHSFGSICLQNTTETMGLGINKNGYYPTNLATGMSQGLSIGEAILNHVNTPLTPRDAPAQKIIFGPKIFFGDLTLKLRE
jgi:hypothetical protein